MSTKNMTVIKHTCKVCTPLPPLPDWITVPGDLTSMRFPPLVKLLRLTEWIFGVVCITEGWLGWENATL